MKPTWWLLYAIGLSLAGMLVLVEVFVAEEGVRSVLQIAVVVLGFGLMAFWTRRNRVALELDDCRRGRGALGHGRVVWTAPPAPSVEEKGSRAGSPPVPESTSVNRPDFRKVPGGSPARQPGTPRARRPYRW
jgi:hypothetical protein